MFMLMLGIIIGILISVFSYIASNHSRKRLTNNEKILVYMKGYDTGKKDAYQMAFEKCKQMFEK